MINSFDLKKAKKMLNIPFGYTLLTGIREDGLEKIVLKKKLFGEGHIITYYSDKEKALVNENVSLFFNENALANENVSLFFSGNNIVFTNGCQEFKIYDAKFKLNKSKSKLLQDNEIYRKIREMARDEESEIAAKQFNMMVESKDKSIDAIRKESIAMKKHYTSDRVVRLEALSNNLVSGVITCTSYDYGMVDKGRYLGGYQWESKNNTYDKYSNHDLLFIVSEFENIAISYGSRSFSGNNMKSMIEMTKRMLEQLNNDYNEETADRVQVLYGLIAHELLIRLLELCEFCKTQGFDPQTLTYSKTIFSDHSTFFEEEHSYNETENIDNYFDSLVNGACQFIQRITGQDVRREVYDKLGCTDNYQIIKK